MSKPSFIERILELCRREGVSEDFVIELRKAWFETSVEIRRGIDEFIGVIMSEPRICLQCGLTVPVNPNGLCDSCLKQLVPKNSIDLQEG